MSPDQGGRRARACIVASMVAWSGAVSAADAADDGRRLFTRDTTPPCAVCHTLADAGATGNVGPSLDDMKPDAARVAQVVRSGLGAMPPYPQLSDSDVQRLAQYVATASRTAR